MKRWTVDPWFAGAFLGSFLVNMAYRLGERRGYGRGLQAEADRVASEALGG